MSIHTICLNCETRLEGPYCHECGQNADSTHRSLRELGYELAEMLTHADSKLTRTLRRLFLAPARLTTDYIAGKHASEIPPMRMFFISLLLMFTLTPPFSSVASFDAKTRTAIEKAIASIHSTAHPALAEWGRNHLSKAIENPAEVVHVMQEWAERFILLMLPITTLTLWLLFPRRKRPLYDHAIFTLHALTVATLTLTLIALTGRLLPEPVSSLLSPALLLALTIHLACHMKGFYKLPLLTTLPRMALLAITTGCAATLLLAGLGLLGLQFGAEDYGVSSVKQDDD